LEAFRLLADAELEQGRAPAARDALKRACAAFSGDVHPLLDLTRFQIRQRDWTGADNALAEARELDAEAIDVFRCEAELREARKDPDAAVIAARERAIALDALEILDLLRLSDFHVDAQRWAEAEATLLRAEQRRPEAPAVLLAQVRLFSRSRNWPRSRAVVTRFLTLRPADTSALMAHVSQALGNPPALDEAEWALQQAERLRPDAASTALSRARLLRLQQRPALAECRLRDAVRLDRWNQSQVVELAGFLETEGRLREAITAVSAGARMRPDSAWLLRTWASLLMKTDALDEARAKLAQADALRRNGQDFGRDWHALLVKELDRRAALARFPPALRADPPPMEVP
jgi:tetratricopeptide (TPR) repeat protein